MTVQWIEQPKVQWLGAHGMLGLTDSQILQRCAGMSLSDPGAQDVLQGCKSQVNGMKGAARNAKADADGVAGEAQATADAIGKLLGTANTAVTAGQCAAAKDSVNKAETKLNDLIGNAQRMGEIVTEVGGMVSPSFGDEEVQSIHIQVGTSAQEVETLTDGTGAAVAGARTAANACGVAPPVPGPTPPPPVTKKKVKKAGWGLALLAGAAVAAIAVGVKAL